MLFRWLIGRSQLRDVQKTIRELSAQPEAAGRICAHIVLGDILTTRYQTYLSPSTVHRQIAMAQLQRGKERRHAALALGATHRGDPEWAAGALIESFAMAGCGAVAKRDAVAITGNIVDWLKATLSPSTIADVEGQVGCRLDLR